MVHLYRNISTCEVFVLVVRVYVLFIVQKNESLPWDSEQKTLEYAIHPHTQKLRVVDKWCCMLVHLLRLIVASTTNTNEKRVRTTRYSKTKGECIQHKHQTITTNNTPFRLIPNKRSYSLSSWVSFSRLITLHNECCVSLLVLWCDSKQTQNNEWLAVCLNVKGVGGMRCW